MVDEKSVIHPTTWPTAPRLASMPNAPLHSTSARPPDGIRGPRCLGDLWKAKRKAKAEQQQKHRGQALRDSSQFGWVERSDTHQACNRPHGYRLAQPILRNAGMPSVTHQQSHRRRQTPHQEAEWNRCVRG